MAIDFYGRLAQQVAAELDACIGCHLCMRACPLPSAPLIQIGEMNDAIGGGPMSQRMLSFTLDCTQCGACVPVCPADLSRMRMVLSAKLRVEEPHPDTPVFLDARGSTVYSGWTVGSLAAQLASYPLFQGVSVPTIRAAIPRMRLRQYLPGETILREGQFSNALRIVVAGTADMRVRVADGREIPLMTVTAGHFFGEVERVDVSLNAAEFPRWTVAAPGLVNSTTCQASTWFVGAELVVIWRFVVEVSSTIAVSSPRQAVSA